MCLRGVSCPQIAQAPSMRSSHLLLGNPGDGIVEDPAPVQRAHAATGAPGGHAAHYLLLKSHEHVLELFHAAAKLRPKFKCRC